ncbi:MAG: hypothetical protein R2695_19815 [Acidimicrobiales bacterium]
MTRKAEARLSPEIWSWWRTRSISGRYFVASASPTPMTSPPTRVSGNERNPPSSAAPSPAIVTTIVNVIEDSPVSGAASTAARAPRAPPSVHVSAASRWGDQPSVCTARSFSALAVMARPTRVERVHAHSANVTATVIPTR